MEKGFDISTPRMYERIEMLELVVEELFALIRPAEQDALRESVAKKAAARVAVIKQERSDIAELLARRADAWKAGTLP